MRHFFLILFLGLSSSIWAQLHDAWLYFTDKPQADYYLSNPLEMLSQKALDRRNQYNISLDFTDVPVDSDYLYQLSQQVGINIKATSRWLNAAHIQGELSTIQTLSTLPFIDRIEFADKTLNAPGRTAITSPLPKYLTPSSARLQRTANNYPNQLLLHQGQQLHQEGYQAQGVTIAVLDNGFLGVDSAQGFASLYSQNRLLGGYNFVNRTSAIYQGGNHGTMVLGTLTGELPETTLGAAPQANYYLFVTEDVLSESPLEESLWVEAAELADQLGVDIITSSLGYSSFDNPNYNYSYPDMDGQTTFISRGLNYAASKGILCVTSAGNSGNQPWHYITAPADAQGSLTVGAVTNQGEYGWFSSVGPTADGRTKPDVVAQGVQALTINEHNQVVLVNGTSFSGPIIAGLAACLWQALPELNNFELMQLIREVSHLYQNPNNQLGYGIPNFFQAYLQEVAGRNDFSSQAIKLYPNPTKGEIQLDLNGQSATITLYNTMGIMVRTTQISDNQSIDISQMQNGMYLYHIQLNDQQIQGKLIKQ